MVSLVEKVKCALKLSRLKSHLGLLPVLLIYFALTLYTSWHIPLADAPDEAAHFMFARFLKQEGFLPFTPEDRELAGYKSDHPPLYAALVAMAFFWDDLDAPPFVKLTSGEPRRHLAIDGGVNQRNVNSPQVLYTEDPIAGEFLFWRFGRLMSTIFGGATLIVIYCLALKIFADLPQRNLWALAAVMSIAFIPTFIFISGAFNYESLQGLWLSLYLLAAVHILRKNESGWWLYLLAGLFIGLAIVTKLGALPAPLSLVVLVLLAGYRAGWPKHKYLTRLVLSILGVGLGAGWWFILVGLKLNEIAKLGWITGLLSPIVVGDGSDRASGAIIDVLTGKSTGGIAIPPPSQVLEWVEYIFHTFWSWRLKGPPVFFSIMFVATGLILAGLIRVWWQKRESRLWIAFLSFHVLLFLLLPLARFVITKLIGEAGQGHHILFPAAGAFGVLITCGLGVWFPNRVVRPWLGGLLLGVVLLAWNISLQVAQIYPSRPPPLPVQTVPPVMPPSANRIELDFESMRLEAYELKGLTGDLVCCEATYPALGLNLYWAAKWFAAEDYRTVVSLVDSQGQAQSAWIGHAANGRYPTRAWEPIDFIRDEIWLPVVGLKPGPYTIKLEIWGDHSPLALENGDSVFTLAEVDLLAAPPLSNELTETGPDQAFQVWQDGQVVDHLPVFKSRSTIQITTGQDVDLNLVAPDQTVYAPERVAGRTHIFIVDPLWSSGVYQLQGAPDSKSVPVLKVEVRGRQKEIPNSQTVVKANFANQIMLLGYNLLQRRLIAGEALPITLHWQALQTMPTDFIMFTRLRDETGKVWGGRDRWPQETYSPLLWTAGEVVEDGFTLQINSEAPSGLYYLDVGFYLVVGGTAVSLPLVQAGQMSDVTSVTIGPIKIDQAQ